MYPSEESFFLDLIKDLIRVSVDSVVMIIGKPGPFQILNNPALESAETPADPPRRRYDCVNYETCLSIACALNWHSFTCRGCNAQVNQTYCWQALKEARKDKVASSLCDLPEVVHSAGETRPGPTPRLVAKRG